MAGNPTMDRRSPDRRSRRKRLTRAIPAHIVYVDGTRHLRCEIVDISDVGARLATASAADIPELFFLALAAHGTAHRRCSVVWRKANEMGVRFVPPRSTG